MNYINSLSSNFTYLFGSPTEKDMELYYDQTKANVAENFNEDIVFQIMEFLSPLEKKALECVSKTFQNACNNSLNSGQAREKIAFLKRNFTQFYSNRQEGRFPFPPTSPDTNKYSILNYISRPFGKPKKKPISKFSEEVFLELQNIRPEWLPIKYVTHEGSIENSFNFIKECILCPLTTNERENRLKLFFNSPKSSRDNEAKFASRMDPYSRFCYTSLIKKEDIKSIEPCKQVKIDITNIKTYEQIEDFEFVVRHILAAIYLDGKYNLQSFHIDHNAYTCLTIILLDQGKEIGVNFLEKHSRWSSQYLDNTQAFAASLKEAGILAHEFTMDATCLEEWQTLMTTYDSIYIHRHPLHGHPDFKKLDEVIVDKINSETVTLRDPSQGRRITVSTPYFLERMIEKSPCIGMIDKENL